MNNIPEFDLPNNYTDSIAQQNYHIVFTQD